MCCSKVGKKTWKSIPKAKIHNCEHSQQWDGLGWEPGIFYECFQSPKAVIPSLLTVLNSLAQSTRLLLYAHSFTQCSWAHLSKIITHPPSEIVALSPFPPELQHQLSPPEGRAWDCNSLHAQMIPRINSCAPVDDCSEGARLAWHPWVAQNSHDPQNQTGKDWSKSSTDKSSSDLLWPRNALDATADFVPVKTCGKWDFP